MRIFFIPLQQNKSNKTENFPTSKAKEVIQKEKLYGTEKYKSFPKQIVNSLKNNSLTYNNNTKSCPKR